MNLRKFFPKRGVTIDDILERSRKKSRGLGFGFLTYGGGRAFRQEQAMLLPTVYRCVELISDSVAQLPLEPYVVDVAGRRTKLSHHPTAHILNCEPNSRMTRFTFLKTLVSSTLLNGNGYGYIQRDAKGVPVAIHYIPPEYVTVNLPKYLDMPVTYTLTGLDEVKAADMIHILNFSYDGVQGISTLEHARHTLGLADSAERHSAGFFSGGCNVGGILTVQSPLSKKQKNELKDQWVEAFSPSKGGANSIAVLDGSMSYSPISINPRDAMLLESRQFSVIDICRFFGVSPTKCFDFSKSSYNTLEQTNLSFLTDTLAPMLKKIELEFERKLFATERHAGVEIRFDTNQLLRGDKAAQAAFYSSIFAVGGITSNEIRTEIGLPPIEGGDKAFVQVNVQPLEKASKLSEEPLDTAPQDTDNKNEKKDEENVA